MQQAHEIANDRRRGPPDDTALVVIAPRLARTELGDSGFAAAMSFVPQKGQRNKEDFGDLRGARRHVGRFAQESDDRSDNKSGRRGQVIKQADGKDFIGSDPEFLFRLPQCRGSSVTIILIHHASGKRDVSLMRLHRIRPSREQQVGLALYGHQRDEDGGGDKSFAHNTLPGRLSPGVRKKIADIIG